LIAVLTGHSLIGEPINLIFGEWAGLYLMHIDRPTSDWACEYDAHGNLFFQDVKVMTSAIQICKDQFNFKLDDDGNQEYDSLMVSSWECACRELGCRKDVWNEGGWPQLQMVVQGQVSNWDLMEDLESSVIKSVEEFIAKFPSYTCEQWHCDSCRKSFGITDLLHCPDVISYRAVEASLHLYAYNLCHDCQLKPKLDQLRNFKMVELSDAILTQYKLVLADINRLKDSHQKSYYKANPASRRGGFH
jgi:hypothetical protein